LNVRRSALESSAPAAGRRRTPVVRAPRAAAGFAHEQLKHLIAELGNNRAAELLGVDKSQLSRCARRTEKIGADLARRVLDLQFTITRAMEIMYPDEVVPWLEAPESLLGGRTPRSVLALRGPGPVVEALDALRTGAFA
jgi:hypothetical protein